MEHKLMSEQELVATARAIKAAGIGAVSESIFRQNIMPGCDAASVRNIALARLVYALSPSRYRDEWYTVALFKGTSRYLHPTRSKEAYGVALLEEAGISRLHALALMELASEENNISDYSDLALAIKFADLCTNDDGSYISLKKRASSGIQPGALSLQREGLDTAFALKKKNKFLKYEKILAAEIRKGESYGGRKKETVSGAAEAEALRLTP